MARLLGGQGEHEMSPCLDLKVPGLQAEEQRERKVLVKNLSLPSPTPRDPNSVYEQHNQRSGPQNSEHNQFFNIDWRLHEGRNFLYTILHICYN